nr:unnamed protein product [Callosobruchus chinensis]
MEQRVRRSRASETSAVSV